MILIVLSVVISPILAQSVELPLYKDKSKDVETRVSDLLSKMTLEEKVDFVGGDEFKSKKNVRLGIPAITMADGPLGPNTHRRSTNYSSMLNLGATFDPELMYQIAEQLGEETRIHGRNMLLGPNVNIARVPHNGRTFEAFGEDPYLMSKMVVPYVKGVQSKNVITSTKHWVANNQEWNRFVVDAEVDERALREIYCPAFKAAVQESDTWTIMAAYNSINGFFACENDYLLNKVLKDEWGFTGFVVTDWGGAQSTLLMANSGADLEMPNGKFWGDNLLKAVKDGFVSEATLDDKVRRILRITFKAGLFDESVDQYGGISDMPHRRALALKTAEESIVLLKNANNFLPLDKGEVKSIAVIGPNGNVARMYGSGSAYLAGNYSVSPFEGITKKVGNTISVKFEQGIPDRAVNAPMVGEEYFTTNDGEPGIYAEYYNNKEQEGEPVYTTIEKDINFNWGWDSPKEGVVNLDKWSAKFTGKFKSPGDGWYEIGFRVDNGVRLYIDGEKVLDAWLGAIAGKFNSVRYKFDKDRTYDIRVDFFENIGTCQCQLGLVPFNAEEKIKEAVEAASKSEVVILALGLDPTLEGESVDRVRLGLDDDQLKLVDRVLEANDNAVVVLYNGTPITMDGWLDKVPAVVEVFYPGQEGGNALANILFGDVNPSGKLPLTFPKKMEDTPVADNYPGEKLNTYYTEGIFVGYRHYDKNNIEPLFPFGFGLSYTTFEFSDLKLSKTSMNKEDEFTVEVTVKNTGKVDGDEIVQLYISDEEASVEREVKSLKGFKRVSLKAGESKTVSMKIDKSALSFYDVDSKSWVVE
ncbi:MAG: glycoside hydrolase family 3 C-terminal domain-containing protein, partial [Melioribacteraceae bacterium]|nr:glycoside hydrolase family 3 C-terminal domain-containing protein [Melioribacteraceae bacterium]